MCFRNNEIGTVILTTFVDDVPFTGDPEACAQFIEEISSQFEIKFLDTIGSQSDQLGIDYKFEEGRAILQQTKYIDKLIAQHKIGYQSKTLHQNTLSSTESEIGGSIMAVCQSAWYKMLLQELGVENAHLPIPFFMDNASALSSIVSGKVNFASRHEAIRIKFLNYHNNIGTIDPMHVRTGDNIADVGTKYLSRQKEEELVSLFMGDSRNETRQTSGKHQMKDVDSIIKEGVGNGVWNMNPLPKADNDSKPDLASDD